MKTLYTISIHSIAILFLSLTTSCSSSNRKPLFQVDQNQLVGTKLEATSFQLKIKNIDQMQKLVDGFILETETKHNILPLKRATRLILSHSNENAMVDKLLPQIITYLLDWKELENIFTELTEEALHRVKARHGKTTHQVTYVILLENIVYELNSKKKDWPFSKKLLQRISNADIKVSKTVRSELQLRTMKHVVSPSRLAQSVLRETAL